MTISSTPVPHHQSADGADDRSNSSTADVAKGQAADVAETASDAGKHAAAVATDQARDVAQEVTGQAKDLLAQARTELNEQATTQQERAAKSLRALADEFDSMAAGADQQGTAADLTRQAAERVHTAASWLEQREPGQLLGEVSGFARRKPGIFLALAAGAGIAVGRLGRGATATSDTPETTPGQSTASVDTSSEIPSAAPVDTATAPTLDPSASTALGYAAPPQDPPAQGVLR